MKSWDYDAVIYEGAVYCIECLPAEVDDESDCFPVFADSEWDCVPVCDSCGIEHDYVSVLEEEYEYDPSIGFFPGEDRTWR